MKRRLWDAVAPRSSPRVCRQQITTVLFVLAIGAIGFVAEQWLAAVFDDDMIATLLLLVAGIVTIALVWR